MQNDSLGILQLRRKTEDQFTWLTVLCFCCHAMLLKQPQISPELVGFSSMWVWENNNLAYGIKERVQTLSQTSWPCSQFVNYGNVGMWVKFSGPLFPHLLNGMNNIYVKVFVRLVHFESSMYEETSIYQALFRLSDLFSLNFVLLSYSGLKVINLSCS